MRQAMHSLRACTVCSACRLERRQGKKNACLLRRFFLFFFFFFSSALGELTSMDGGGLALFSAPLDDEEDMNSPWTDWKLGIPEQNPELVYDSEKGPLSRVMRLISVWSVLAVLVAVGVYVLHDPPRQCFQSISSSGACFFSESYFAARCRFREAAAARNASLTTLRVGSAQYTIDVAIVNEHLLADRVVMVSSGVHGVEGFAGSATQLAILHGDIPSDVCVVLVHAVNPFGFAELRRWNGELSFLSEIVCEFSLLDRQKTVST